MKSHLSITLLRSTIGTTHTQRLTVAGLGLRKIGHTVTVPNTPSFRGMAKKVLHLVQVQEIDAPASKG